MSEWTIGKEIHNTEEKRISDTEYFYFFDKGEKFLEDKVLIDNSLLFILLDGVIFNKLEILKNLQKDKWDLALIELYEKEGLEFIKILRGSFNGVIIDKKLKETYVFVDQLGERAVFYCADMNHFFVSNNFNRIVETFKKKEIQYSIDEEAVKCLLYFGYMVDNRTCVSEIKRIFPGNYLHKSDERMEEKLYFRFTNQNLLKKTEHELIELIDSAFSKALIRELEKDKEYGYYSLMDISGGMDARIMCFAAKKLGYRNITNLCYSQMNAYEKNIAENLVRQLGNDYMFKSLDNASFIYELDALVKENYGLSYFAGITGGRDFLKVLDKAYFGIEHTGILGDIYEGSFNDKPIYEKPNINEKYRVSRLLNIDLDKSFLAKYEDDELFKFYTRGILAGTSTHLIRRQYMETYSPFADVDFLNLMFSIPLEQRITGKIYMKWVNEKYPEALEHIYSGTMCNPNSGKIKTKLRALWNVILIKIVLPIQKKLKYDSEWNYRGTMNPFEYWYEKNANIKEFINEYYEKNIGCIDNIEIKNCIDEMQVRGKILDKMVMLTVLSVYKQYGTPQ